MLFWVLLIVVLALAVILLILSEITIQIGFHRSPILQRLEATIYLFRKVKVYKKSIMLKEPEIKSGEEYKEYILRKVEKGVDIFFSSLDAIASYNDLLKDINSKLSRGLKSGKFEVSTRIGTGDAAVTALLAGLVWSVLGNLRIQREYHDFFKDLDFSVYPDFKKKIFAVNMNCIFTIKTVYIIYVFRSVEKIFKAEKHRIQNSQGGLEEENLLETG